MTTPGGSPPDGRATPVGSVIRRSPTGLTAAGRHR